MGYGFLKVLRQEAQQRYDIFRRRRVKNGFKMKWLKFFKKKIGTPKLRWGPLLAQ